MKKYILLAAAVMALAACNNDDDTYTADAPVEAHITATIGESAVSRVSDSTWGSGDRIGITSGVGKYVNIEYTTTGDGFFTGNKIYFKNKREPEDFTAYYPFTGTEGTTPAPVETFTRADNQTSAAQPRIDFLYAEVSDVLAEKNSVVAFSFTHQMSRITFTFINGNNGANVSLMSSYTIEGLVMKGAFDPQTGVCAATGDVDPENLRIDVSGVQSGVAVASLILFPQSVEGKEVMLRVADSEGGKYFCELSFKNDSLEPGNHYQYTIIVNKTEMIVGKSSISPWEVKDEVFDATIDK